LSGIGVAMELELGLLVLMIVKRNKERRLMGE
jgi:hypothetical protein